MSTEDLIISTNSSNIKVPKYCHAQVSLLVRMLLRPVMRCLLYDVDTAAMACADISSVWCSVVGSCCCRQLGLEGFYILGKLWWKIGGRTLVVVPFPNDDITRKHIPWSCSATSNQQLGHHEVSTVVSNLHHPGCYCIQESRGEQGCCWDSDQVFAWSYKQNNFWCHE